MPLTDRIDVIGQHVYTLLNDNKVGAGLQDVWYGDQSTLPHTPAACVETGPKRRTYNGVPRRFEVDFEVYILLYMERIQDFQKNRKEAEELSEAVEVILHQDPTLGGLAVDSYVSAAEPGYATRGRLLVSAVRLTLAVKSQRMLPSDANPNPA